MSEIISSINPDDMPASESTKPTELWIDGRSMRSHEIERAIELAMGDDVLDATDCGQDGDRGTGNSLSLNSVGLNAGLVENLIRLIRRKKDWESISLSNFLGDRTLCNDLLLACTTHPSIRSLTWRTRIADSIHTDNGGTLETTDSSTLHALLYGLKYNSHLTRLDTTGLVLDVNMANLFSRALVRNRTLTDLSLSGARFLSENSNNNNDDDDENHKGTKNMTVQTLSFGLRFNRTIESLSLEMCNDLEDQDIACLINAVNSDGTVLRHLSLQETACFDQGMSAIAELLQENVIEELNLSYLVRPRNRRKKPEQQEEKQQQNREEEEEETPKEEEESPKEEGKDENEGESKQDSEANAAEKNQDEEKKRDASIPETPQENKNTSDNDKEQSNQQVRNTSLKVLSMAGNCLDDDYLESLLGIFPAAPTSQLSTIDKEKPCCSSLEELTLLGNRFSNHGIKALLKKLPRFPYLQRLYLGYQRPPPRAFPRHMASDPSLRDRNAEFNPGAIEKEFVAAVSENPSNFRLTNVSILAQTTKDKSLEKILKYHMRLNTGGRKLLASYASPHSNDNEGTQSLSVPLGLWPLVLDRANRLYPLSSLPSSQETEKGIDNNDGFHAGDVIFSLLHGPMIFENLDRRPEQG